MEPDSPAARPSLLEALVVWAALGAVAIATVVTYARIPAEETYHVSRSGVAGGLGRMLVFLNFPTALIAVAILPFAAERAARLRTPGEGGALSREGRRPPLVAALWAAALGLCLVVAGPGVLDETDLDATPVNVIPALGVGLVLALTVVGVRCGGIGATSGARGDLLRLLLGAALILLAVPWTFAELGFYAPAPFLTEEVPPGEELAAVHLGRHHGMDGVLLAVTSLALSRALSGLRRTWLRLVAAAYLALMLAYGLANAIQDAWLEQVVKRGWTDAKLPEMLHPELSAAWAALVGFAAAVLVLWFLPSLRAYETRSRSQSPQSDMGTYCQS